MRTGPKPRFVPTNQLTSDPPLYYSGWLKPPSSTLGHSVARQVAALGRDRLPAAHAVQSSLKLLAWAAEMVVFPQVAAARGKAAGQQPLTAEGTALARLGADTLLKSAAN